MTQPISTIQQQARDLHRHVKSAAELLMMADRELEAGKKLAIGYHVKEVCDSNESNLFELRKLETLLHKMAYPEGQSVNP